MDMDRCLAGFLAVSENLDRLAKANLAPFVREVNHILSIVP